MRIVVALGGNALLKRGEPMTADAQRANVRRAAVSLAELIREGHQIVVTHGNGPQVGLLALQSAAGPKDGAYPLDILGAETEGMIGYLIEQKLGNLLPEGALLATLLTQVRVDANDPAFGKPTKPIGPVYEEPVARKLADERGWHIARDGDKWRRGKAPGTKGRNGSPAATPPGSRRSQGAASRAAARSMLRTNTRPPSIARRLG
jgi:carbamate kinase